MNEHEGRIHAMLTNRDLWPCLNDEDRAAIKWLHDYAWKLKDQLADSRRDATNGWREAARIRHAAEEVCGSLMRIANDY